jgi:steroid 5-alpha reductase family enzyme
MLWVISLPLQAALLAGGGPWFGVVAIASLSLWLVGLWFESVGDWQLARFKADPRNAGRIMDRGLWAWTRHPNYFGDFAVWWGHFGLALALGVPWWTIVSPIVMSVLLMKISGVPLLEASLRARRPGYAEYVRRTSAFFPRPPRA